MACLETDFLVALSRKDSAAVQKLLELERKNERLFVTPISASELFYGAFKSKNQAELDTTEGILQLVDFLPFDFVSARYCGLVLASLDKEGKIGDLDSLTGAICARHSQTLITRNLKHFSKVKNLKIETF